MFVTNISLLIDKHVQCLARRSSVGKFETTTIFVAQNSRKIMTVE